MDGMLCDRCGAVASHFHEDYGNVCPRCVARWSGQAEPWYCPQCGEPAAEGGIHERCKTAWALSVYRDRD